jgi:hypothetical protein
MATDPEKFPTFLSQLPAPPQNSDEDEIITTRGKPVTGLEMVRLAQSAVLSSEGRDLSGRVFRLKFNTIEYGCKYQYKIGLLEDGTNWSLMSRAELFDNCPTPVSYLDYSLLLLILTSKSFITLKGVCMRPLAVPARLSKKSIPEIRQFLAKPGVTLPEAERQSVVPQQFSRTQASPHPGTPGSAASAPLKRKASESLPPSLMSLRKASRANGRSSKGSMRAPAVWSVPDDSDGDACEEIPYA